MWLLFAQASPIDDFGLGQIGALGGAGALIFAGLFRLLTADRSLDKKMEMLLEGERNNRQAAEAARDIAMQHYSECQQTVRQANERVARAEERASNAEVRANEASERALHAERQAARLEERLNTIEELYKQRMEER